MKALPLDNCSLLMKQISASVIALIAITRLKFTSKTYTREYQMTQEANPTDLLFPTATKEDVTRKNVQLQIAQSFRLIDQLDSIVSQEGELDPAHVAAVVGAFRSQLEEMTTIVSIQNDITVGEYHDGCHALEHFYEEQIQRMAQELVAQAQAGE